MVTRRLGATIVAAALTLLLVPRAALAVYDVQHPVTDVAGVLTQGARDGVASALRGHQSATGVQIAVLLVPTTEGRPIEDYAFEVATRWRGGAADSRGILVLLAIQDRRSRIEVGYGLEDSLPDRVARTILDSARGELASQMYGAAVARIVDAVIERTGGHSAVHDTLPATDAAASTAGSPTRADVASPPGGNGSSEWDGYTIFVTAFIFGIIAVAIYAFWRASRAGGPGAVTYGAYGGHGYDKSASLSSWSSSSDEPWWKSSSASSGSSSSVSWFGDSSSSSSSSWSSSSDSSSSSSSSYSSGANDGGYSGGGGDFGGGGASSGW